MNIGHNNLKFQLVEAAKNGDRQNIATQNAETILSFCTNHRKDTLLHIAAVFGHDQLTQDIANRFPGLVTCKNFIGDTPIHVAARSGKILVVKSLLTMENPPNDDYKIAANEDGNTPLHEALIHNRDDVAEFLLWEIGDLKNVLVKVNKKGKSPLNLAVESQNTKMVEKNLKIGCGNSQNIGTDDQHANTNESLDSILRDAILGKIQGNAQNSKRIANPCRSNIASASRARVDEDVETTKHVLHAAVAGKDIDILRMVAEKIVRVPLPDNNSHLLHLAASQGVPDFVKYLLDMFNMDVLRHDKEGFCPIHLASKNGHLQVTIELLQRYPDAREFLSERHQNVLHVAAENGKVNIVQNILKTEWAEFLLNEKDKDGNTPLHLATKNWHPKVVSVLTWAPRVDLKQVNHEGLTALEVAEKYMEVMAPFKKRLTWIALRSVGTPRDQNKDPETVKRLEAAMYEPNNMDYCKGRVNTLLLVSALVGAATFAAGFTMPGGNSSSDSQHAGMASMLHKIRFRLFVICDSIAMYSSIIVMVMLMWAQLGDLNLMLNALRKAQLLLGLSLAMMSLTFLAGVNLVVTESSSISIVILFMGIASLIILLALYIPLFLPYTSKFIIFRYISYYPLKGLMLVC
ncbi:hypothetical protein R6Q59_032490 [Mikania micrantha]